MVDQIFELFKAQPALSISLGFLLTGFLSFVFKGVIVDYIKKKYDLYSRDEINSAFNKINNGYIKDESKLFLNDTQSSFLFYLDQDKKSK